MFNIKKQNTRHSAVATATLLVALVATNAYAHRANASEEDTMQIVVTKQDLSSEHGIETLYDRLKSKSKRSCKGDGRIPLGGQISYECLVEQLQNFVSAINNQDLSSYHDEQSSSRR